MRRGPVARPGRGAGVQRDTGRSLAGCLLPGQGTPPSPGGSCPMPNIEAIVRRINKDLVPQFETSLREHLAVQDREWLIEQIVRLTLDAHSLHELDRRHLQEAKTAKRQERIGRIRELAFDRAKLISFLCHYASYDRDKLIARRMLLPSAPEKGASLVTAEYRTSQGNG